MFGCSQERERRDHATNIVTKRVFNIWTSVMGG